ncbi:haloacid dehalogenase-like hydrolase [Polynucleobacter sp. MWH-UH23A]|uniref:haloacid dehalogenase-like hydrolase n=1 Tax=Polynucleobacter sp. MWH-UH23A TaxID=1855613 RepID=UPI003364ED5E
MKVGIDFDNTIVSYDKLFYQIALEKKLIPPSLLPKKIVIRDYLRSVDKEDFWTLMQGEVYGSRLNEANPYPYFFDFIKTAQRLDCQIFIISHKTKAPFLGPAFDLHKAANEWIIKNMNLNGIKFDEKKGAFFEVTKEKKIDRIAQLECDVFIDDLPEILSVSSFPKNTKKILFDPDKMHQKISPEINNVSSWKAIQNLIINDLS